MANAGRVELDLVAVGKDEVSLMLRNIEAQVRKTAKQTQASAAQMVQSLADLTNEQVALEAAALGGSAAWNKVQSEIEAAQQKALVATQNEIVALERELAVMQQLGAEEGPLAAVNRQRIAGLKSLQTSLKQTETAAEKAAKETKSLWSDEELADHKRWGASFDKDVVGKLRDGLVPLNRFKETLSQFREVAFFGAGAVIGLFTAVGKLVDALSFSNIYIAQWEEASKDLDKAIESVTTQVRAFREELGLIAAQTAAEKAVEGFGKAVLDLQDKLSLGESGLAAYNDRLDELTALDGPLAGLPTLLGAVEEVEKLRNKTLTDMTKAQEALNEALDAYVLATKKAREEANKFVGPPLPDWYDPTADYNFPPMEITGGGASGGRAGPGRDFNNAFNVIRDQQRRMAAEARAEVARGLPGQRDLGGVGILDAGGSVFGDNMDRLFAMTDASQELANALSQVADSTQLVAEAMPAYGAALSEIQEITDKVTEGKMNLSEALAAGSAAIAANAAKAIGGVRAEAAVRAAYEFAMGWATLANPPVSAGHFTASALLGAVAAGAGGGGGGSRSSSGGSGGGSSNGGGPSTIVYNISTLVTDPHQLQRATSSASRSTQGTGMSARAGV